MPPKLTREILTEKHVRVLRGRSRGLTFAQIAKREDVSESTIMRRFGEIRPFLHRLTLKRLEKPDHAEKAVALRLGGKTLRQIGDELALSRDKVHQILKKAADTMPKEDAKRLAVGGTRIRPSRVTYIPTRQKAVRVFFEEINRFPNPYGTMQRARQRSGLEKITRHLTLAGINWKGEIQRRRLALALKVANTMHSPREQASTQLQIEKSTLGRYRQMVREGRHLTGALELVSSPEAGEWWDLKMPEISEGDPHGGGRINLKMRNNAVQSDLKTFKDAIELAKQEMGKYHPDKQSTEAKAGQLFKRAYKTRNALRKALARYKQRELQFRTRYGLPVLKILKAK